MGLWILFQGWRFSGQEWAIYITLDAVLSLVADFISTKNCSEDIKLTFLVDYGAEVDLFRLLLPN